MAELVRGSVGDRPWGRTFAALGLRAVTGQLMLFSDGKRFVVVFEHGAVVAAMSPLAADAGVRVALTTHLISSSQVPEISRRQAAAPDRDEIDVIAELARLGPEHTLRLRRRAIAQRAARTFSINQGEFVVTDITDVPVVSGCELDVRAVVYIGARANLSEQRLSGELDQLGAWFRLKPGCDDDLPQFGFTDLEQPIIERLREGGTLEELEGFATGFVDSRTVRAVVYALAASNTCDIELVPPAGAARARSTRGSQPRVTTKPAAETLPLPRGTWSPSSSSSPPARSGGRTRTQPLPRTLTPPAVPVVPAFAAPRVTPAVGVPGTTRPEPAPSAQVSSTPSARRPSAPVLATAATAAPPIEDALEVPVADHGPDAARREPFVAANPQGGPDLTQRMPSFVVEDATDPALQVSDEVGLRAPAGTAPHPRERRNTPADSSPASRERRGTPPDAHRHVGTREMPFVMDPRARDTPPRGFDPPRRARSDTADFAMGRAEHEPAPGPTVLRRRIPTPRAPGTRPVVDSTRSHEVKALIAQRLKLLDQGVDHFQLLGIPQDASTDLLRRAYFGLARQLHPDRLAALGIPDDGKHAQRLFAEINAGFAILSDKDRRAEYLHVLRKGGAAAIRAEQAKAEQLARQILDAEEAFRRGELALRRDQPQMAVAELEHAVRLNPEEADYHALLAWSRFVAAPDKHALAAATRAGLDKAIERAPRSVTARFYLGRVERMLGRDAEAQRHFRDVLAGCPGHSEAAAELRVLEVRSGGGRPGPTKR